MAPVTASVVQYQVIRPDGTVLWRYVMASPMDYDWWPPPEHPGIQVGPEAWIDPPYLIQRREFGPEWVTIAER